ncbi:MAG: hypothetical protein ABI151_03725 [Chitinophagaceae bacterium]
MRIYAEDGKKIEDVEFFLNAAYPWKTGKIIVKSGNEKYGDHFVL